MTDAARLAAIRERAEKATPGPWRVARFKPLSIEIDTEGAPEFDAGCSWISVMAGRSLVGACIGRIYEKEVDLAADFIAHARDDIPWLLAELTRLSAEVSALRAHKTLLREAVQALLECPNIADSDFEEEETDAAEKLGRRALAATAGDGVK